MKFSNIIKTYVSCVYISVVSIVYKSFIIVYSNSNQNLLIS